MSAALLRPRFLLRDGWPWLVGAGIAVLLELLQPFALAQLARSFHFFLDANAVVERRLPMLLSVLLCIALIMLPQVLCRRQGAGTSFLICMGGMFLPLLLSAIFLRRGLAYEPFATLTGLWIASSLHFARQLRETQRILLRAQRHAQATLYAIADGVLNVAPDGELLSMNPVAMGLARAGNGRLGQHVCVALGLSGVGARQLEGLVQQCASEGRTVHGAQTLTLGSHQMRVTAGPIFNNTGQIEEVVLAFNDISESVAAHNKLYHDAHHDAMTGLPNRSLMTRRLNQAISHAMQNDGLAAVFFVDIDYFNRINDSFGHYIGDAILIEVAHRLQAVRGKPEHVSRWGGDEYVVLLDELREREQVSAMAESMIAAINAPMNINGVSLRIHCSIGISLAPSDSIDVDELLAMADAAMSRSKLSGAGGYRYFSPAMSRGNAIDIESALREALHHNEFELYFQPQVAVKDGRLVGMEALLRWSRPGRGMVPPDHFIPVAEEVGLIIDIGVWTLHRVAQQLKQWRAAGLPLVPVSVNVSARQCLDHRITKVIADAVHHAGISTELIKIELTEATTMNNVEHLASLLRGVHGLGVRISVDDFGTAYSSLSFLKRFPISQIKIDRSFVHDITLSEDDAAIVSGTIALAHELGIEVVAEGVETAAQLAFLRERGCDIAQGFYFSQPLVEAEIRELLRQQMSLNPEVETSPM